MKYNHNEKKLIRQLDSQAQQILEILEEKEQGKFVAPAELIKALGQDWEFIAFSCLSGSAKSEELGTDLGRLFTGRITKTVDGLLRSVEACGYARGITVILDDCEPSRVWQWNIPQEEVTTWYQMVIEEKIAQLLDGWRLVLWSDIEHDVGYNYQEQKFLSETLEVPLLLSQTLEYMTKFPRKHLRGKSVQESAKRRLAEYLLQGEILERKFPNAILIQTETPWKIKDPRYLPLRNRALPIIHPYFFKGGDIHVS